MHQPIYLVTSLKSTERHLWNLKMTCQIRGKITVIILNSNTCMKASHWVTIYRLLWKISISSQTTGRTSKNLSLIWQQEWMILFRMKGQLILPGKEGSHKLQSAATSEVIMSMISSISITNMSLHCVKKLNLDYVQYLT